MNGGSSALPTTYASMLSLSLTPNPATTQVQISIEGVDESGGELTVFDAMGRMVWQQSVAPPAMNAQQLITVDVSNLASGLYQVRLNTSGGVASKGLIVNRL